MTATMSPDALSAQVVEFVSTQLLPTATTTSGRFVLGVATVALPRLLRSAIDSPLATSLGVRLADGSVDLQALRELMLAGLDASGGITVEIPFASGLRFTRADVDALFDRLG